MRKIILVFSWLISAFLFAQEKESVGRFAEKSDIIGFWKKVNVPELEMASKENPFPLEYQWFGFYENGKVCSMMTNTDDNYSAEYLRELFSLFSEKDIPNYTFENGMMTIDNKDDANYLEVWGVNIFTKDYAVFKKGWLVMSLDDGEGNPIYYRVLEKLK